MALPQFLDAGSVTATNGSRAITGDSDTLANVLRGQNIVVVGHTGVWDVASDAVDDGGGDGDFTIIQFWTDATDTAQAYVSAAPLDDNEKALVGSADAITTFSGRSTYDAQSEGYQVLCVDGFGSDDGGIVFKRVTSTNGVWQVAKEPEDGESETNLAINPTAVAKDPYIADAEKGDTEEFPYPPFYALCQADGVTASQSTSDVNFSRGLKLTKTTAAGRMGFAWIVLASEQPELFDRLITLSLTLRNSTGDDTKCAILSDTGTDKTPLDPVDDWTDTTYTAGNFFISGVTVHAVGTFSMAASETNPFPALVSDSAASLSTQGRLIFMVWNEASMATSAMLEATGIAIQAAVGVPTGSKPQPEETVKVPVRQSEQKLLAVRENYVINPEGVALTALYGSTALTDTSFCDSFPWYALCNTSNVDVSASALSATAKAKYPGPTGMLTCEANATQRMGVAQGIAVRSINRPSGSGIIDDSNLNLVPTVFSALATGTNGNTLRYAVLSYGAGFTDQMDLVNDWTSATFTAGNFFINGITVHGIGSITTLGADSPIEIVLNCTSVSGELIYVFFWTDEVASTELFQVGRVQLEPGVLPSEFVPEPIVISSIRSGLLDSNFTMSADDAYDATNWNGDLGIPTKNAIRDQLETTGLCRIATGSYTGDGSTSQAITGVGFQPKALFIVPQKTDGSTVRCHITSDTIVDDDPQGMAYTIGGGSSANNTVEDNAILSLDSDGFTVSDNSVDDDPNTSGVVYNYIAWG